MTSIALFIDRAMVPGAHVVLFTAALHHGSDVLDVHVFQLGLTESEVAALRETLQSTGKDFRLTVTAFDPEEQFRTFNGLHGSKMTYGRLLLPALLPHLPHLPRVLYLDSDLLVRVDLQQVFSTDLDGHPLAAVATSTFKDSLDGTLALARGVPDWSPHFNAGVLLLDLDQWRRFSLTDQTLAFVKAHGPVLRSHDQSALNFVFRNRFKPLPRWLNVCVEPWNHQTQPTTGILHFIGSPKPFDPGTRWLHARRREFETWLRRTAVLRQAPLWDRVAVGLRRLWHTRRSIVRCALRTVTSTVSNSLIPVQSSAKRTGRSMDVAR